MTNGKDVKAIRKHFDPSFTMKASSALRPVIGEAVDTWIESLQVGQSLDLMDSGLDDITIKLAMYSSYGEEITKTHLPDIKRLLGLYNDAMAPSKNRFSRFFATFFPGITQRWPSFEIQKFKNEWEKLHGDLLERREKGELKDKDVLFFLLHDQIQAGIIDLSYEQVEEI